MDSQLAGRFPQHLLSAILLTFVVSFVIVTWYRQSVARNMRIAAGAPAETDTAVDKGRPGRKPGVLDPSQQKEVKQPFEAEKILRRRLAVIYGLGGLAASGIMTTQMLLALGDKFYPIRTFIVFYVYCWPIPPTLSFLLGWSRGRALLAFAAFVAAGLLLVAFLGEFFESILLQRVIDFLLLLLITAWLPFMIIFVTSGRRIRSIAPVVLAMLLLFSIGNFATDNAVGAALESEALRPWIISLGVHVKNYGWYLLAAIPTGYVCWQALRWVSRHYERKAFSDAQLFVDAWWVIVTLSFAVPQAAVSGWSGFLQGLFPFVAYRVVVQVGLILWQRGDARLGNRRLLLLRVFGFRRRTEKLFDIVAQRWRWIGSVRMIAGADLATRIIGPGDLLSFMGGRLSHLFVRHDRSSLERLEQLDEVRDPDGRYRVNKVYCQSDSWQRALQRLLATTDFVVMDLRGFSEKNQGCLFELQQIAEQDLITHTVFVVDDSTDTKLLRTVLPGEAAENLINGERGTTSLNLVHARSASASDVRKVYSALRALDRQ